MSFFGFEISITKKDSTAITSKIKNIFLFSSKLSNELRDNPVIANCEFEDYLKVSDRFSLYKPENIIWKNKEYKVAIIKDAESQLSLSSDKEKQVYGSLVVIYNKEETWIQRMDNDPTRELNYLSSIRESDKHAFYEKLEQDYYPVRASHDLQKNKNLSLFIHIYRVLR